MPLYEYRCPECETVDEVHRMLYDRDEPVYCEVPLRGKRRWWRIWEIIVGAPYVQLTFSPRCGAPMERIHSLPARSTREPITNPSRMPKWPIPKWY